MQNIIVLQDLNIMSEWNYTWDIEFNLQKCKVIEFGKSERGLKNICIEW